MLKLITPFFCLILFSLFSACDQGERYKEVSDHRITMDEYTTGSDYYLRIIHPVENFTDWETFFNQNDKIWLKNGLKLEDYYRSSRDTSTVVIMMQVTDMDAALRFVNSNTINQSIQDSGVDAPADISFLKVEN